MHPLNQLILGDNLEILKNMDSETVDLIYLDPPFFSNRNYEVIWGDAGEVRSFQDRWAGGVDHYIAWLKERVMEMHRILKPTGSIFLHCDWHANAYIRVEILDKIFGYQNFKGEITWQRHNAHNDATKKLAVLSDTIWYYSKSEKFIYNPIYIQHKEEYLEKAYRNEDKKGRYTSSDLTGAGINKNDVIWKGYSPAERNRHWAIPVKPIEEIAGKEQAEKLTTIEKLELLNANDYIEFTDKGTPRFKRHIEHTKGILVGNIWTDINNVQAGSKEKIGYPTQKPEALLKRIIECASNEGDFVLDPFVGGGTTITVAEKLKRNWLGIDQSVQAIKVTEMRLNNQNDLFSKPFIVQLHKYDYDTLRYKDAFEFESFIVNAFGGRANTKQRGDLGLDGKTLDNAPIQVKRSDNIGRNVIDNFHSAIQRYDKKLYEKNKTEKKPAGYIIAFSFGKGAVEEVARLNNTEDIIIKLVTVETIVPIAKKPTLTVQLADLTPNPSPKERGVDAPTTLLSIEGNADNEIQEKKTRQKAHSPLSKGEGSGVRSIKFTATGVSAAGVEFYSWDFNYDGKLFKAEILLDKKGEQVWKFKPGEHLIAVKVVDNDGLENIEVIKLKVNGKVERN